MKVAIYSRKSRITGKGESIQNQINLCKQHMKKYFDVEDLLSECNSTNRLNAWSEYLNDIFNSIIFA